MSFFLDDEYISLASRYLPFWSENTGWRSLLGVCMIDLIVHTGRLEAARAWDQTSLASILKEEKHIALNVNCTLLSAFFVSGNLSFFGIDKLAAETCMISQVKSCSVMVAAEMQEALEIVPR